MSMYDWLIILILVMAFYYGYQRGVIKQLVDFIILLITMIISSPLSKLLCKLLYPVLPFFNLTGEAKGIKSINLIIWRLIIYFILIALILLIVRRVFIKLKLAAKIKESIIEAGPISKIIGALVAVPLAVIILYNVFILINVPIIEFSISEESSISKFILEDAPIISSLNKDVYLSENYARQRVFSSDNTTENYKKVNNEIINNMLENNLTTKEMIKKLKKKNKLVGTKVTILDEIEEETGVTSPTGYNTTSTSAE